MIGRTVAQYQFLERLGAGGMGEIYKARDTRLNRIVAIKTLSQSSSGDAERRRRFAQEAQAASALNHPNIVTVHDIVSDPDADAEFLVMEFVAGNTLADLIPSGGLRVPEILQYATQITDALSAAHAAGIIHRDIKPTNIMVTGTGLVKVLDFGLAKVAYRAPAGGDNDATQTVGGDRLTIEGSIMGTVSYMSPEQAEGKTVDPRSDIFSFGVVLYEMVTGSRAFGGDTALSILTAILRDEVRPIAEQTPDVPSELVEISARCLRKKSDDRWQSMRELHVALQALKQKSDSGTLYLAPASVTPRKGPRVLGLSVAIVLTILLALAGWWLSARRKPAQPAASAPADFPSPPPPPAWPTPESVLTNEKIIEMIRAKVPASIVIGHIRSSKTKFDLSTAELIRLTSAGVPEAVIQAMGGLPIGTETQPAESPAASPAVAAPPIIERVISVPDGSPISIEVAEDIPADAQPGAALRFTVTKDFVAGDTVVVAKGAAVTGEIVDGAKKKFLGIGSKMTFRLDQLDAVNGQKLKVRATSGRQGDSNRRRVETGAQKKTKDVAAAAGSEYVAYVEGDQTVSVRKQ